MAIIVRMCMAYGSGLYIQMSTCLPMLGYGCYSAGHHKRPKFLHALIFLCLKVLCDGSRMRTTIHT